MPSPCLPNVFQESELAEAREVIEGLQTQLHSQQELQRVPQDPENLQATLQVLSMTQCTDNNTFSHFSGPWLPIAVLYLYHFVPSNVADLWGNKGNHVLDLPMFYWHHPLYPSPKAF